MAIHAEPPRLRIAYFSPLPPARSGIADYSSELLSHLAAHADITLFSANPHEIEPTVAQEFSIQPIDNYPAQRWHYDIALYQMGNSTHHTALYEMFLRYPGIVVLHDYSLHQFIAHRTINSGDMAGYSRELGYELGLQAIGYIKQGRTREQAQTVQGTPLNKRLLDLSLGVIVHSQYAKNLILEREGKTAVSVIPQHITTTVATSRRQQLPWPSDAIIFASAGQVTAAKQIEFTLRAFKKARQENPRSYYLIIGEEMGDSDLSSIIHSLNLSDCVQHIGYVASKQEFTDWIYTADCIINLRYPTVGETSAIALRALAAGRPLILFDHGWYSELPDSICIKTPPFDENALVTAMSQLAQQPDKRRLLGEAGSQYIKEHHCPIHVANAYLAFIRQQIGRHYS